MPRTKTAPETPEALRERAERLRAEAFDAEALVQRQEAEKRAALAAHQDAWDREFADTFDRPTLDAEVDRAAAEVERALEADPLVQALVRYFHAQSRRRHLTSMLVQVRGRLGYDVSNASLPDPATMLPVGDYIARAVERVAANLIAAELAEIEARRNGEGE